MFWCACLSWPDEDGIPSVRDGQRRRKEEGGRADLFEKIEIKDLQKRRSKHANPTRVPKQLLNRSLMKIPAVLMCFWVKDSTRQERIKYLNVSISLRLLLY